MTSPHQNLLGISGAVDTEETDPNFNQTVLLLHGDGTNGGQNNSFLDSSTNNFSITRNGNTTQGTFNPFMGDGQYSVRFEQTAGESGDDLEFTGLNFTNTGSFCVELFFYKKELGQTNIMFSSDTNDRIQIYIDNSNQFGLNMVGGGTPTFLVTSGISANEWHHFCITRDSSNNVRGFIDGVLKAYKTSITNNQVLNDIHIGSQKNSNHHTDGIISNVRFVASSMPSTYDTSETSTGTTCFTIPSEALTLTSQGTTGGNVKLLCCQSNRFIDNSNNGFTAVPQIQTKTDVTNTTGPKVVPFSPFAPTASYSESVHGGSGHFDGTGDYLSVAHSGSLQISTNPFIIEAWIYPTECSGNESIIASGAGANANHWLLWLASGVPQWLIYTGVSPTTLLNSGVTLPKNAWAHILVTRDSSNNQRIYINGVEKDSDNNSAPPGTTDNVTIGAQGTANVFQGYISGVRMDLGVSQDANFTIPSVPKTATGNNLLLSFTNASVIDQTMVNNIETVGDAQLDTTVKKFGTASIEFPSGDALAYDSGKGLALGKGPFTVEFFVRFIDNVNASGSNGDNGRASLVRTVGTGAGNMVIQRYDAEWRVGTETNPEIQQAQTLSNGVFYHVAMTRDSSNKLRLFVDGTMLGSDTSFTQDFPENDFYFANFSRTGGSTRFLNGFLDEIRITKGVARYDSDSGFTAPTKAFPNR